MGILFGILVLIIAVVIYTVYHKVMKVYYFSGKAFINEIIMILIISSFLAMILMALLGSAISFIFSSIGKLIGFILTAIVFIVKWGLIIGGIVLVGILIKSIFLKDKNNVNLDSDLKIDDNEIKNNIWAPFKKSIELIIKDKKKLIIFVFAIIGLIAISSNTFSQKGSKEYYINMVKNMESGLDGYTLEEFLESTFKEYGIEPNIEWNYIEDKQIVSVTLSDNTNSISRYYSVKNAPNNIEEVYIDGSSVNEHLSNVIGEVLDDRYYSSEYKEDEVNDKELDDIENENLEQNNSHVYGTNEENDLERMFSGYGNRNEIENKYDTEELKKYLLGTKFSGFLDTIGECLNEHLEEVEYNILQAERGTSIYIKGYCDEVGTYLNLTMSIDNNDKVSLKQIRQGMYNTEIDMSDQIKIARIIFNFQ